MDQLFNKLRKYEIMIRKVANNHLQGEYQSLFKGSGLEFDDLRPYQYGDDIRTIEWKVSAKGHGTFVKTFREEKEQSVYFLLDISGSQDIGQQGNKKIDQGKLIAGVLTLAAVYEGSQIGLISYSDEQEKLILPSKGSKQGVKIIRGIFDHQNKSLRTNLNGMFTFALNLIKKRSIIIIISDFIDQDYERPFRALAERHDVVAIQLTDPRESALPSLGIIPIYDKEKGKTTWVNTAFGSFSKRISETFTTEREYLKDICKKNQINYLAMDTTQDIVGPLIDLFKYRNKRMKRG
ncbi:MAG: DUF58 domain-containing protein [Algoriphagus sp.]|jgi:uncharacterized protein (DUF58 family)|uniref:DUF58 domain-containing protein n=1 Tax=Algoriphagus sp. TaxID=1872435 RepID=UPI001EC60897|nr:DUF58 domain-containing protein [Algoriphagus sp.]MBA4299602.1 DUF58 domain-containing protein [Cyclobacterium sp.]MDO8968647.1 DUF58 domain-containing protein [Algoriphagus sp.]MDP2039778.1 DUF58 domain-containing protein [Algoriphagus sp.]MDP3200331.1 DUF58 domain-containing protein [Algoriphagus sp.]MDP3471540.1 DUF58 domain-containing protein [Algoriphagus sp.]